MRFSQKWMVVAAIGVTAACGRGELSSRMSTEGNADVSSPVVDHLRVVPTLFDSLVGHEICSGKVSEEWTAPENGQKIRQVWQRRASFVDMMRRGDNFSVGYKVRVDSDFFVQTQDGTWQADKKSSFDSHLQFNGVWSESLKRFVGQTHWLSSHKDGVARDLSAHSDQKITAIFAQGEKVVMKYVDIFPRAASDTVPAHLSSYEETLGLVDGKLERTWSYQNWAFNPETLEPTTVLNLGEQPSFDTEVKCAQ